jgi:cysteine desulfurase / selenocysteine lyase
MSLRQDSPDIFPASEFPVLSRSIYLNHAAVAPWPRCAAETVARFAQENAESGAAAYPRWLRTESEIRNQLAMLVGAPSSDDIALLKNTSEALSFVARGFPWHPGDNVVIPAEEFPSNRIVWESLTSRGVQVRRVPLSRGGDAEDALRRACDDSTRLVSVSSVQYARGLRLDLEGIGRHCRARDIAFCVDAIQGLGAVTHDVQSMHIDFLMADAHKWLMGPEGIAVFYCAADWRERLALQEFGWHMVEHAGDFDRDDWQPARSARRFECGSPNMLGIHALSASLGLFARAGIDAIERRILDRAHHVMDALAGHPEIELLTPTDPGRYAGIVTFRHRKSTTDELMSRLQEHGIIAAARGGGIRFSPHFYIPFAQLDRAIEIIVR